MEIGDYVRTKKRGFQPPQIARITNMSKDSGYKNEYYIALDHNLIPYYEYHIYEEDVYKSSPNLIDLIEVGDYINDMLITNILVDDETGNIELEFNNNDSYLYVKSWNYESRITKYKIKSIVTKEQMKEMEYRVNE